MTCKSHARAFLTEIRMSTFLRIFLVLTLLLSGRGQSVCYDNEGNSHLEAPAIVKALTGQSGKPCNCPNKKNCQEHEIPSDTVLSTALEIPQQPCFYLPLSFEALTAPRPVLLPEIQAATTSLLMRDPDVGLSLTDKLLGTIVLRV